MKKGDEKFNKFKIAFMGFIAEINAGFYDKLYSIAFENNGGLPDDFSCSVCETFRKASGDIRGKAFEFAKYSLIEQAKLFKEYYLAHVGEPRQGLTIYEKDEIFYNFLLWFYTTLITKALAEQRFSEETLLPFLSEALEWAVEYAQRTEKLKVEMYDLLTEALAFIGISREDFLSLLWESRLDYGRQVWNYHTKKSTKIIHPNWPTEPVSP
ncbi:MAG: hypothetical protein WCJ74_00100 [bacterium]